MFFAFIVVAVLCSPLILGPLIIPAAKRRKTSLALERMRGDEERDEGLPEGLVIEPLSEDTGRGYARTVWCEEQVDANLTKVDCGGRIHHVGEVPGTVDGVPYAYVRLATVCFVCGRLAKTGRPSRVLGRALDGVNDAATLETAVIDVRRRQPRARDKAA